MAEGGKFHQGGWNNQPETVLQAFPTTGSKVWGERDVSRSCHFGFCSFSLTPESSAIPVPTQPRPVSAALAHLCWRGQRGRDEKAVLDPLVITVFSKAVHETCHCLSCHFPPPLLFWVFLFGFFLVAYHDQEAGSWCTKEILIPLPLHLKAKMTNFCAMLHYTGIKEQKGEGQWLHGVLIRCRSA